MAHEDAPDDLGDVALGDHDPRSKNRIQDYDTALARAHAEKPKVEKAQFEQSLADRSLEIDDFYGAKVFGHRARRAEWEAEQAGDRAQAKHEILHPASITPEERQSLADEAVEWYEGQQTEMYNSQIRRAVGILEAIQAGRIEPFGALVYSDRESAAPGVNLDRNLKKQLREAVYQEAGIEKPPNRDQLEDKGIPTSEDNPFYPGKSLAVEEISLHGRNGVTLTEQRFYRTLPGGMKRHVSTQITASSTERDRKTFGPDRDLFSVE